MLVAVYKNQKPGSPVPATAPFATDLLLLNTLGKAQWQPRFVNASDEAILLRWKIFALGSTRASPIAKCWKAWSKLALLIFLAVSELNSSRVSMKRSALLQQHSGIA